MKYFKKFFMLFIGLAFFSSAAWADLMYVAYDHAIVGVKGTVQLVDTQTSEVKATIALNTAKRLKLNAKKTYLYVLGDSYSPDINNPDVREPAQLGIIDTATNQVVKVVSFLTSPVFPTDFDGTSLYPEDVVEANGYAYVSHSFGIEVVDLTTFSVIKSISMTSQRVGNAAKMVASPDGNRLYVQVTNLGEAAVGVIDTLTNELTSFVKYGNMAEGKGIAISPDGKTVYAADSYKSKVFFIDTTTLAVTANVDATVDATARPYNVVLNPAGTLAYTNITPQIISGSPQKAIRKIAVIDTVNRKALNTISLPEGRNSDTNALAMNSSGTQLYVATNEFPAEYYTSTGYKTNDKNLIYIIDTTNQTITGTVRVEPTPADIVILDNATVAPSADWKRVMNWAEKMFPNFFPTQNKQEMEIAPYQVRFYPVTNTYLGFNPTDNRFYGYNPTFFGAGVVPFGFLNDYLSGAIAAGF